MKEFGRIDILVNTAANHYENEKLEDLSTRELVKTFETIILFYFRVTNAPCLNEKGKLIHQTLFRNIRSWQPVTD